MYQTSVEVKPVVEIVQFQQLRRASSDCKPGSNWSQTSWRLSGDQLGSERRMPAMARARLIGNEL